MEHHSMQQAIVEATIAEMKRALQDPGISVEDHALDKSTSLGDEADGSIEIDLDMVPGGGPHRPAQHGTWTDEKGATYLTATFSLTTPTTVRMNFVNHARATIAVANRDGDWETAELTPEQQETLDQYATEAAFWLTGTANGALMYTDEDPDDYDDEDRNAMLIELDQMDVRRELGRQALTCTSLAKRTSWDDRPNAAYLDAAALIRTAAAKVARANYRPGHGEARTYHETKPETSTPHPGPADRFYLELDSATDPAAIRKALADAGITVPLCQAATQQHNGYILTEQMARTAWEEDSGYSRCQGECRDQEDRHHSWDELDQFQKDAYLKNYAMFTEVIRTQVLALPDLLQNRDEFDEVLLVSHAQE